ncbi:MAG: hypothetical protein HXS51_06155 [Theionarchaea archaeon]|nr:hypothetical protein [Theionarchaea archaeon]
MKGGHCHDEDWSEIEAAFLIMICCFSIVKEWQGVTHEVRETGCRPAQHLADVFKIEEEKGREEYTPGMNRCW